MGRTTKSRASDLADDAVIRNQSSIADLVGVSRWTIRAWMSDVDEAGRCVHPIARLCFWDGDTLCLRLGDWRRYVERRKRASRAQP